MMMQTSGRVEANPVALWFGILAGPIAWTVCEGLNYALDQHACSTGHFYVQWVVSVCTLLFALSGAAVASLELARVGVSANEEGGTPRDRSWFMARLGIASGIGFALVIIALAVPHFIMTPCD